MIFIDSNIPMYYTGTEHPNRTRTIAVLEELILQRQKLITNTEVLQEILHRYRAIQNTQGMQNTWDCLYSFIDEVHTIEEKDVKTAKEFLLSHPKLSSRDTVHIAFMKRLKITKIFSFDKGFDEVEFLERIV